MLWEASCCCRKLPPTNKNTLICALTEEWDKLPQQLLDNVEQTDCVVWLVCHWFSAPKVAASSPATLVHFHGAEN
ncbi:hypothetical protein TNCV_1444341 [Trichonephila clavipes]|nr:hypothetical protein TNCV_1444341 [Trichonephila clavipes]